MKIKVICAKPPGQRLDIVNAQEMLAVGNKLMITASPLCTQMPFPFG